MLRVWEVAAGDIGQLCQYSPAQCLPECSAPWEQDEIDPIQTS